MVLSTDFVQYLMRGRSRRDFAKMAKKAKGEKKLGQTKNVISQEWGIIFMGDIFMMHTKDKTEKLTDITINVTMTIKTQLILNLKKQMVLVYGGQFVGVVKFQILWQEN